MKIKIPNQTRVLVWIYIYILFVEHGTNILSFVHMTTALPFTLITIFLFFGYGCHMTRQLLATFVLLFVNYTITGLLSGASLSEGFNYTGWLEAVFVIMGTILINELDNDVMTKFIKIVLIFSVISLFCYSLVMIGADAVLKSVFKTYDTGMGIVSGKWFYVYNWRGYSRNSGVFTEPGIFQVVLVMSIYVILFMSERITLNRKQRTRYLIVLLITLITTKSAAAYIGLFAMGIGILLKKKDKRDYAIVIVMIIGFSYLIFNYYSMGENSILSQYFFGKFAETQKRELSMSSGGARLVAMQMGIQAALSHPFGIGYLQWEKQLFRIYGHKFGTGNALFTQLGTKGFLACFISLYFVLVPALKRKKGWIEYGVFAFLFLYIVTAQSKILYPAIVLVSYLKEEKKIL